MACFDRSAKIFASNKLIWLHVQYAFWIIIICCELWFHTKHQMWGQSEGLLKTKTISWQTRHSWRFLWNNSVSCISWKLSHYSLKEQRVLNVYLQIPKGCLHVHVTLASTIILLLNTFQNNYFRKTTVDETKVQPYPQRNSTAAERRVVGVCLHTNYRQYACRTCFKIRFVLGYFWAVLKQIIKRE